MYLNNKDSEKYVLTHIYAKCIFAIRNNDDYSCFYTKGGN